jgi:hypothetical protein
MDRQPDQGPRGDSGGQKSDPTSGGYSYGDPNELGGGGNPGRDNDAAGKAEASGSSDARGDHGAGGWI